MLNAEIPRSRNSSVGNGNGSGGSVQKSITISIPADYQSLQQGDERRDDHDGNFIVLEHLWRIARHKWSILAFVAVIMTVSGIRSWRQNPVYESTATIEVDRGAQTTVVGRDSQTASAGDTEQFLATQMRLIQSDSVLRPVVKRLDPELMTQNSGRLSREAGPVELSNLTTTRPPNTFIIQITYRHPNPQIAAQVANAVARSYIEHVYEIRFRSAEDLSKFMGKQLEELRTRMEKSGKAVAEFEREFQVINPEEKTSIFSAGFCS